MSQSDFTSGMLYPEFIGAPQSCRTVALSSTISAQTQSPILGAEMQMFGFASRICLQTGNLNPKIGLIHEVSDAPQNMQKNQSTFPFHPF
jgi:hypothetical protein